MIILNSVLYKYEIDLRLVINGFQKPLKRFVHRDNPHNPHYTVFKTYIVEFGFIEEDILQ